MVYVDSDTLNVTLDSEGVVVSVEAVKTLSELFMPLSGEVIEIN